jgi:hypothetical protein
MGYPSREVHRQKSLEWYRKNRERVKAGMIEYYKNNRDTILAKLRERRPKQAERTWNTILAHYGSECACCGETIREFLTIDHIKGRETTKEDGRLLRGHALRMWLIANNFPPGYQVLCFNCNIAKSLCGECPHKRVVGAPDTFARRVKVHPDVGKWL